jgi:hypothetical protein
MLSCNLIKGLRVSHFLFSFMIDFDRVIKSNLSLKSISSILVETLVIF